MSPSASNYMDASIVGSTPFDPTQTVSVHTHRLLEETGIPGLFNAVPPQDAVWIRPLSPIMASFNIVENKDVQDVNKIQPLSKSIDDFDGLI